MSRIICTATECKWHDAEADACSKGTIFICPTIDSAEPAYCDSYEDSLSWIEEEDDET